MLFGLEFRFKQDICIMSSGYIPRGNISFSPCQDCLELMLAGRYDLRVVLLPNPSFIILRLICEIMVATPRVKAEPLVYNELK